MMFGDQRRTGFIETLIKGGQHDRALRQTQHCPHQANGRRNTAGDTRNDHRPARRMRGKPLRFRCNHLIAPQRWRQLTRLGQMSRPVVDDNFQELKRLAPVRGVFLRHQFFQTAKTDTLGLHHVHQLGEFSGEIGCLRRRGRAGGGVSFDVAVTA